MLAKSARLNRSEFTTLFSRPSERTHLPLYSIYSSPALSFKASVVVGKKVAKLAVKRNALRREVYAGLQAMLATSPDVVGSYIFIIKPPYATLTKVQRHEVIRQLLAQITKAR